MRVILALIFVVFALPAFAQQERECRGKQPFDLGDGAYGCLMDVGLSTITTTRTRDDFASESSTRNQAGQIRVLMFGAHSTSKRVISPRLRAICKTFLSTLKAEQANAKFHRVIVVMIWPRVANTGDYIPVATSQEDVQLAFSSDTCRGVRYFG